MPRWRRVGDERWFVLSDAEAAALRVVRDIAEWLAHEKPNDRRRLFPNRGGRLREKIEDLLTGPSIVIERPAVLTPDP